MAVEGWRGGRGGRVDGWRGGEVERWGGMESKGKMRGVVTAVVVPSSGGRARGGIG